MDELEIRLHAAEFLLSHLISRTRSPADLRADREELQRISDAGEAKWLMVAHAPANTNEIVRAAVKLLEDAEFQQGGWPSCAAAKLNASV
jgi:hypothetical protein